MSHARLQLGLSPRDRRTLAVGGVCIGSLLTVARGIPALQDWQSSRVADAQSVATQVATVRTGVRNLPSLRDSLRARQARLAAIDTMMASGDSPSSIAAVVASTLESIADDNAFKVTAMELHSDSVATAGLAHVQVRVTGITDVAGLAGFLHDIEQGDTLMDVRELSVAQPEPTSSDAKPETLHVDLVVAGIGRIAPQAAMTDGRR